MRMRKKGNGKGKIIGLARDYSKDIVKAPYILLKSNGLCYVPDGAPKSLNDLVPFIDRGSYRGITLSARKNLLDNLSGRLLKEVKRLETISI